MADVDEQNGIPPVGYLTDDLTLRTDPSARVWRFSGLDSEGNVIAFEFAGPTGASETLVFKPSVLIGRDRVRCDFVVADRTVSRVHAMLRYVIGQGLMIMDMDSGNGTFVDGQQVGADMRLLRLGSELKLGQVKLQVSYRR